MTERQLIVHRTILSEKRAAITNSLLAPGNAGVIKAERLTYSLDQSAHALETAVQMRLKQNQRRLLRAIDAALDRINRRTFGTCETCGESIPDARLIAVPWTRQCRDCKERVDSEIPYLRGERGQSDRSDEGLR